MLSGTRQSAHTAARRPGTSAANSWMHGRRIAFAPTQTSSPSTNLTHRSPDKRGRMERRRAVAPDYANARKTVPHDPLRPRPTKPSLLHCPREPLFGRCRRHVANAHPRRGGRLRRSDGYARVWRGLWRGHPASRSTGGERELGSRPVPRRGALRTRRRCHLTVEVDTVRLS
jgi:hypothetical protein